MGHTKGSVRLRLPLGGFAAIIAAAAALLVAAPAALALNWGSPTTVSGSGELTQNDPSTAIDAKGDAVVAWANYSGSTSSYDCPCQVRVAMRAAGGSFGSPVTIATMGAANAGDNVSDVHVAMDAVGDAILVWDYSTPKAEGSVTGTDDHVYASVSPAGGSFSNPQQISHEGTTADGGGAPVVAMDSAGDAIVGWISGLGWYPSTQTTSSPQPRLQVVRRPAGANSSFSSPTAVTGSGTAGPFADLSLAMSPNGHAAFEYTWCSPADNCGSSGSRGAQNNVEVVRAAPGASFGSPEIISPTVTNPGSGQGPYEWAGAVAIDDNNDATATYNQRGSGPISTATARDEVVTSDAGAKFSSAKSLGVAGRSYAGQATIAPDGTSTVTLNDNNGLESNSRPPGGSFGANQLVSSIDDNAWLAASSNAEGSNGDALVGLLLDDASFDGADEHVAAALRPAGGAFGAPVTIEQVPSGSFFDTGSLNGSIDKSGDGAVLAWAEYQGSDQFSPVPGAIRVALAGSGTPPPAQDTLTVSSAGTGAGTVTSSPAGISCPGTCSGSYAPGTPVTLTATPAAGSTFAGWSGGGCSGTGSCVVTMSSDQSVTSTFTAVSSKPSCSLSPKSSKVLLPRKPRGHKKHKPKGKPGILSFTVTCNQAAAVQLTGKVLETLPKKGKHGKRTKTFTLSTASAAVQAQVPATLTFKLPTAALSALKDGKRESVTVTLTASNANGSTTATAAIPRIRAVAA